MELSMVAEELDEIDYKEIKVESFYDYDSLFKSLLIQGLMWHHMMF